MPDLAARVVTIFAQAERSPILVAGATASGDAVQLTLGGQGLRGIVGTGWPTRGCQWSTQLAQLVVDFFSTGAARVERLSLAPPRFLTLDEALRPPARR